MKLQLYNSNMGQLPLPGRATLVDFKGEPRYLVPPINALITDAIGLAVSGILFFLTDSIILKILAGAAAGWMGVALVTKLISLPSGPVQRLTTQSMMTETAPEPVAPVPPVPDPQEAFQFLLPEVGADGPEPTFIFEPGAPGLLVIT